MNINMSELEDWVSREMPGACGCRGLRPYTMRIKMAPGTAGSTVGVANGESGKLSGIDFAWYRVLSDQPLTIGVATDVLSSNTYAIPPNQQDVWPTLLRADQQLEVKAELLGTKTEPWDVYLIGVARRA